MQIAAAVVLVGCGLLLPRSLRPARASARPTRRRPTLFERLVARGRSAARAVARRPKKTGRCRSDSAAAPRARSQGAGRERSASERKELEDEGAPTAPSSAGSRSCCRSRCSPPRLPVRVRADDDSSSSRRRAARRSANSRPRDRHSNAQMVIAASRSSPWQSPSTAARKPAAIAVAAAWGCCAADLPDHRPPDRQRDRARSTSRSSRSFDAEAVPRGRLLHGAARRAGAGRHRDSAGDADARAAARAATGPAQATRPATDGDAEPEKPRGAPRSSAEGNQQRSRRSGGSTEARERANEGRDVARATAPRYQR